MKFCSACCVVRVATFLLALVSIKGFAQDSRAISFDQGWRFKKDGTISAEAPDCKDGDWRLLDLPHDWSIEDLLGQNPDTVQGPFSRGALAKNATGYTEGGTGWYRKTFALDGTYKGKRVYVLFDGVYMNADVWVNGHLLGNHPYGYTSFYYDLTDFLYPTGKPNVLAVRVRNEGRNSRWYSGSGIYRHVWLLPVSGVHSQIWGVHVTTPEVTGIGTVVRIDDSIANQSAAGTRILVKVDIADPSGKIVTSGDTTLEIGAGQSLQSSLALSVASPALWSLDHPTLYHARITLLQGGKVIDRTVTPFGIRSLRLDPAKGLLLNGAVVKLKGGCIHHDLGPLGAASIDRAEERKIELLKKAGFNAIRLSHNPPAPALLDACDRLGMLVIDEAFDTWDLPKNAADYHLYFKDWWQRDLQSMLLRDRNHPSVILWSIGNEIYDAPDSAGYRYAGLLSAEVRRLDSTRGVTEALVYMPGFTKKPWEDYEPHLKSLDVVGFNYFLDTTGNVYKRDSATLNRVQSEKALNPDKLFIASEYVSGSALENWGQTEKYPYFLGAFCWTAMDYMGEAGIGRPILWPQERPLPTGLGVYASFYLAPFPIFNAYCGDLDLIGDTKAPSAYKNVLWGNLPLSLWVHRPVPEGKKELTAPWGFPDEWQSWTWPGQEGKMIPIHVYSKSGRITLTLNGKVVADQQIAPGSITASFLIPYQPGTLVVNAYDGDKWTGSDTLRTVGQPAAIRLVADRAHIHASRNDLSYVHVDIVDKDGNTIPWDEATMVHFKLTGPATIAGVGNGSYTDASSFQQPYKKVYRGKALVIIRPSGKEGTATLEATGGGLRPGKITITMD